MTESRTDDSQDQLAAERTKRPRKMLAGRSLSAKKLPKPLLRLLLIFAAIVVVAIIIVVAVTSATNNGQTADYQRYMSALSDMLKRSDTIGKNVVKLLTQPGDTTRKDIQTRLDQAIATSKSLEAEATALEVPKDVVKENIHQYFVLVMHFRFQGLTDLKPSLMNALELQDVEVPGEQVSRALTYLTNSDFLYREVFAAKATQLLKDKQISGVSVPDTQFISDPDIASKAQVQEFLAVLKSTGSLQAVHGVAVSKVVASPDDKTIAAGKTYNLTSSDELAFLVSVENQGNMSEKDVPVVVTLLSPDKTEPQKVTVNIPELKPKQVLTVTVKGLDPTAYGEQAALKVKVGPVKDEKFTSNNTLEANVIFTL